MFPQEKSKGSRFVFPEGGGDVCTQATTSRLIRHGHFKTNLHKTCCNQIQQGHRTGKFWEKDLKTTTKKSMNKDVWSYFKHFGRLPGKIHLFLTPSKTYWRMKRFPASTRHRQKYITHWRSTLRVIDRTRGDWFSHNCSSTCTILTDFSKNFTWNNIVFLVCNQFTMPKERTEVSCCVKYLLFFFNVFFWVSLFEKWQK